MVVAERSRGVISAMADRSTIVTALGLILRRMNQLAERLGVDPERLDEVRRETGILQKRWQLTVEELNRLDGRESTDGIETLRRNRG
jgi:hypothetical protein